MCMSLQTHFHEPQGSENTTQEYNIHTATLRFLPDPYRCLQHVYSYQSGATMTAPKCETIYKALFSIYFWRGAHTRLVLTIRAWALAIASSGRAELGLRPWSYSFACTRYANTLVNITPSHIFALCWSTEMWLRSKFYLVHSHNYTFLLLHEDRPIKRCH